LDADLSTGTMSVYFAKKYPERFFNCGIAEANMVDMAAGFALTGKIPFCHSFAMFSAGRCFEMIRNSIAYPNLNVRIVGSHAGITVGRDGATHQCLEDLAIMRSIPNMTVIAPCDAEETRQAVHALVSFHGPVYLRTSRVASDEVVSKAENYTFEIGKAVPLASGSDVTLAATGILVPLVLQAAETLAAKGIHACVLDFHTIKPLDEKALLLAAKETGAIVTVEEHNVMGGFGSAVCEVLAKHRPTPVEMVGMQDEFGRSGEADELLSYYHLTPDAVVEAALRVMKRRDS
jgi:transketolase